MKYWDIKVATFEVLIATFWVFGQHFSNFLALKKATFHDFASIICLGLPGGRSLELVWSWRNSSSASGASKLGGSEKKIKCNLAEKLVWPWPDQPDWLRRAWNNKVFYKCSLTAYLPVRVFLHETCSIVSKIIHIDLQVSSICGTIWPTKLCYVTFKLLVGL